MNDTDSPIELAVNTNRLFMEGLHAVLDIRFSNRSPDDRFKISLHLRSRLLPEDAEMHVTLHEGQQRRRSLDLHLPRAAEGGVGSAGDARFDVELIVDAGEEGKHHFVGEFILCVLAYTESRREINVNIGKLVEQHGDKAGMGAINEFDMSDFIKLPESMSVNDLITQPRAPRFTPIELEYEGELTPPTSPPPPAPPPSPVGERDVTGLTRCALDDQRTGARLLVHAGDSITLGCGRAKADIVTWVLPRSEENDWATRHISNVHCEMRFTRRGLTVTLRSKTNPAWLNDEKLIAEQEVALPIDAPVRLRLASSFELSLTALSTPPVAQSTFDAWFKHVEGAARDRWTWSGQSGIGAILIERNDLLAAQERYLWLISACALPQFTDSTEPLEETGLLSLPNVAFAAVAGGANLAVDEHGVPESTAWPIAENDQIIIGDCALTVGPPAQTLDI
ncbi:MAG: FHA domain-containing protein [Phycisphaerales bacterium]|nr:FHA domain-containing protein [Phycisphaerales bacterium]